MIIAVMSDSHDHMENMKRAVSAAVEKGAGMIIHCGDLVAPFMLPILAGSGLPVHAVFGNNDGDRFLLTKFSLTKFHNITFHGEWGRIDDGNGFAAAFTHYRETALGLFSEGKYRLVCYGHTHQHFSRKEGGTLLLNPGEIMGKDEQAGFCLVDTITGGFRREVLWPGGEPARP